MHHLFSLIFLFSLLFLGGCGGSTNAEHLPLKDTNETNSSTDVNASSHQEVLQSISNYKFVADTKEVTIHYPSEKQSIQFHVVDNDGFPVTNQNVYVGFFNKGSMDTYQAKTAENGRVSFTYTAPEQIDNLSTLNIAFSLEKSKIQTSTIKINFISKESIPSNINLSISDANITIHTNKESVDLVVSAFDDNNFSVSDGSIIVQYPSKFISDNIGGGFTVNEVPLNQGKATFTFTAPDTLENSNGAYPFKFFYKSGSKITDINVTSNIQYLPSKPTVILSTSEINATLNSETFSIDVKVFNEDNTPYDGGSIKVVYPTEVKQGFDVGLMSSFEEKLSNGVASFVYTAPKNLSDLNTTSLTFKFYHTSSTSVNSDPKTYKVNIDPAPNQIIDTSYAISMAISDAKVSMGLKSTKTLTFALKDEGGTLLNDSNITEMNVTVLNTALATLSDLNHTSEANITTRKKNSVGLKLTSKTISGIVPLRVDIKFKDLNNENKTLTDIYNIVILSGPPTAMSITYASTTQDSEYAKFEEHLIVSVVDKYFNPVNTNPAISIGTIVGYSHDANESGIGNNYVYFKPDSDNNATLDPTVGSNPVLTAQKQNTFKDLDENNDVLAIFAKGYNYAAGGKWDFNPDTNKSIILTDTYDGNKTKKVFNLGYAAGNNKREDVCNPGTAYIGNIAVEGSSEPVLDDLGRAKLKLSYDYFLTGKDVVVYVNLLGYQADLNKTTKVGTAKKITLRGNGLEGQTSISYARGSEGNVTIYATVTNTGEFLHNAHFTTKHSVTGAATLTLVYDESNNSNIYDCTYGGIAKQIYHYSAPDTNDSGGTITLTVDTPVISEF